MPARPTAPYFVTCAPGLEALLHAEIRVLRLSRVERQVGGVYFEGTPEDAMRANLHLRFAVRILRRISRFEALDADQLYEGVAAVDWAPFLPRGATFCVSAHSRSSLLDHTLFVEQRAKDGLVDSLRAIRGERPDVDKDSPDLRVHVHLFRDRCTLAVDTSGDSLHRRGWRCHQGRAPLAETLAAAVVELSGWDRRSPLIDPFCGSGSILVEAMLIAGNHAPGLFRSRFAFEGFADFDPRRWARLRSEAEGSISYPSKLRLFGFDRDPAAIEGAEQNLAAAGLTRHVELGVANVADFSPRSGWNAWVVTNPPYGQRVGEGEDLRSLYRSFGTTLRDACDGYHFAILSGDPDLTRALGLRFEKRTPLQNGAIECELVRGEIGTDQ
jgi:putative N6-adenine-specific DNA methylase